MKNIALFGGSFDPPHLAHLQIVEALRDLDYIDKVVVMPTYLNPFKSKFHTEAGVRLEWLRDLFAGYADVEVSSFEVDQKTKVPTLKTVKHLKKTYKSIYLVIGADNLSSLKEWYGYDDLKELVTFIVASRGDIEIPNNFIKLSVDQPISSTQLRENIDRKYLPPKIADKILNYYKENNVK
ncbi:MAG: nicotinate (nicotinamide) nucleotide adenylyltransferase [Sulfurimonas sp.]